MIVSADRMNASRADLVIVVLVTRTYRRLASHVELAVGDTGFQETRYAKGEDVKSVPTQRLVHRIGRVPDVGLRRIVTVVAMLLDM